MLHLCDLSSKHVLRAKQHLPVTHLRLSPFALFVKALSIQERKKEKKCASKSQGKAVASSQLMSQWVFGISLVCPAAFEMETSITVIRERKRTFSLKKSIATSKNRRLVNPVAYLRGMRENLCRSGTRDRKILPTLLIVLIRYGKVEPAILEQSGTLLFCCLLRKQSQKICLKSRAGLCFTWSLSFILLLIPEYY